MGIKTIKNTNRWGRYIILCAAIFSFFLPISYMGQRLPTGYIIIEWCLWSLCLLSFTYIYSVNLFRLLLSSCIFVYLGIATVMIVWSGSGVYEFSIARLAPIVCFLVMANLDLNRKTKRIYLIKLFDVIVICIIIINILLLLHFNPLTTFIVNNYTQYNTVITTNLIMKLKPICTFGVGNIAAFFYAGIFLIATLLYSLLHHKKYMYYMLLMILFCVLISNTTSLGYACLMILYIVWHHRNFLLISFVILVCAILFLGFNLLDTYIQSQHIGANGFIPRYLNIASGIFSNNMDIIQRYPLGIGYALPIERSTLYYADSGYFITCTMGNICGLVCTYSLFFLWTSNIKVKKYRQMFCIYVLLMEFGYITFYSLRTLSFLMYVMIYLAEFTSIQCHQIMHYKRSN